MMKQDSQSIQQLMVAEKRAEEKVNQARKRKALRLKQAKEEAHAEIQNFKLEKETEFKEYEAKFAGSKQDSSMKIEQETGKSIEEMEKYVRFNQDTIINYLLDEAFTVNCQLHQNFRITNI